MKLVLALGNPGTQYTKTRHNVAWRVADTLADTFTKDTKLRAAIARTEVGNTKIIIAKPETFMNLSGESARLIADYFKIETRNIIAIFDDKDLPFGKIRFKNSGGHGGHNGVKNLIAHLGADFVRVKIGVANDYTAATPTDHFVLSPFSSEEEKELPTIIDRAAEAVRGLVTHGFEEMKKDWVE